MNDQIAAIYPLSPTQQGMLFHALYAPADAVYDNQVHYRIDGPLDAARFQQAWQAMVDRHAVLRTLFTWEKRDRPLQVVSRRARLPWHVEDWRGMTGQEQQLKLRSYLESDRARGFDLGKAPLFRAALFQLADHSYEFVCTHHHLILDGWSASVLTREVLQAYDGAAASDAPPPFESYIGWLREQDVEASREFWQRELSGVVRSTQLPEDAGNSETRIGGFGDVSISIPPVDADSLREFVRQQRVTLNSVIQAAWALLLSRNSGDASVVFGATVSGRPAHLPEVERMIGCFINTLPVRIDVPGDQPVAAWLRDVMLRQVEREQLSFCGLSDIQRWMALPPKTPLFESIVVVENHSPGASAAEETSSLRIHSMRPIERTNYPLTLVVDAGHEVTLKLLFHEPRFNAERARMLLDRLVSIVAAIVHDRDSRVGDLVPELMSDAARIEALLLDHPAVKEAVVVANGDGRIAYVVPAGKPPSAAVLRAYLQSELSESMLPSAFELRDQLPRSADGRIDRDLLSGVVDTGGSVTTPVAGYVAPRNVEEELLAEIWSDVLGVDRVGVHDDYFDLGGDSIRGISIVARGRKVGLDLTLQHVFELRTIGEMTRARRTGETLADRSSALQPFALISAADRARMPSDIEDAYPIASLQAGMLYHALMSQDVAMYHNVSTYWLRARFDADALREALAWVAARHPVLRTAFDLATYSEALQLVRREIPVLLIVENISGLSEPEQIAAVTELFEQEKRHAFDVATAPLWRVRVQVRSAESFQLTLTEHHAILDGWSVASLVSEVLQRYYVLLGLSDAELPAPPSMRYAEFVAEEKRALGSNDSRTFWRDQVRGLPSGELKGDAAAYPPSPVPPPLIHADVTPEISTGLKRVAKKAGVPLKSVLLGIHLRALQTLVGQRRVATGLVSNGRLEATDGDRVLGLFLNSIPFVMELNGARWIDLFQSVFHHEATMLPHRRFPLAEMQRELGGAAPFDSTFNFTHFHAYTDALALHGLDVLDAAFFERANFALAAEFGLDPKTGNLRLGFDYDPARLTDSQVTAIAANYVELMSAVVADATRSYADSAIVPRADRQRMIVDWNATAMPLASEPVADLVRDHATADPDRIAIICGDEQTTYGDLNRCVNRLANVLRSRGVGPEVLVAVCVDRSVDMVVALLAVMTAGGAYVPLDPSWPRERLRMILDDAQPRVLISRRQERMGLPDFAGDLVLLDEDRASIDAASDGEPTGSGSEQNAAYVIYTSGSTGRPKGVTVTHANLANFLRTMSDAPGLGRNDTLLAVTTISFDIAGLELFLPLTRGARIVIATRDEAADGTRLMSLLDEQAVSVMQATPSTWRLLRASGWSGRQSLKMLCGGEALPRPLAADLIGCGELWNVYGPTETTIWSTLYRVDESATEQTGGEQAVSIGRPIGNTQTYVLDGHVQSTPIGYRGELCIAGAGVARGYRGRPSLTAASFVPDPFSAVGGARMYRTGDLASFHRDGSVAFAGRRDQQVKVRGHRIELGEIEAVLATHLAVQEAAVAIQKAGDGDDRLVAYVVAKSGATLPTREDLRAHVEAALPEYMIPAAWVTLPALPRTPNGKINRRGLPSPNDAMQAPRVARILPRDEMEQLVAQAWRDSLQVDDLGVDDNFFDVGGHSLLMIRLHEKLRRQCSPTLQLVDLFRHPTIRAQARFLADAAPVAAATGAEDRADRQRAGFQRMSQLAAARRSS